LNNSLTINGDDIKDLRPLLQLEGIGGDLTIKSNASLITLTGLNNLKSIGGTLRLENNIAINDLTGFDRFKQTQLYRKQVGYGR